MGKYIVLLCLAFSICKLQIANAAIGAATVWEIRTTGSSNNAGGYDSSVAGGADLSQADSASYNSTDLATTSGTTNPCVVTTTSSHNFVTNPDAGNFINITTGGTFLPGRYEIKSASGNAATLDRACASGATTSGGTYFVGGAYKFGADAATFLSTGVVGNKWWLGPGTHSLNANVTFTAGSTTILNQIEGYNSSRGDSPTGSNRPTFANTTGNLIIQYAAMKNLIIKGSASSMFQMQVGSYLYNVKVINNTSNGAGRNAINCTQNCHIINSEVISWGGQAVNVAGGTYTDIVGSYIHDSSVCVNVATSTSSQLRLINSILASCYAQGVNIVGAVNFAPTLIMNNTFYGQETPIASSIGIKTITASSEIEILNNIFYGWSTALQNPDASSPNYNDLNDFFLNTADVTSWPKGPNSYAVNPAFGNVTNIHGTTATSSAQILTDSGANFSGVTDNVDTLCITASTGGSVGCYLITAHSSTTVTADSSIASLGTGSSITYVVTLGHNFAIGPALKRKATPTSFGAGLTNNYLDIGGAQRREYGRPVKR